MAQFNLGDKVVIGGRTMLRPGLSLVGMTGRIVTSRYDAPSGTVAIWLDWEAAGYTDTTDLPPVANVPAIHVALADQALVNKSTPVDKEDRPRPPQMRLL